MKPLIGITAGLLWEHERKGFQGYRRQYLSLDYTQAVIRAGGIPVILPLPEEKDTARELLERLDGLILSGGPDVSPLLFGEEPSLKLGMTVIQRDRWELALLEAAMARRLPILGICRGFQLLNLYFGGSVYQDISEGEQLYIKHNFDSLPGDPAHHIQLEAGSLIAELLAGVDAVNSHHHQVLKRIADKFRVTAWAPDGAPEAMEAKTGDQFILGVQFHPEMMVSQYPRFLAVFSKLIQEAEKFRET